MHHQSAVGKTNKDRKQENTHTHTHGHTQQKSLLVYCYLSFPQILRLSTWAIRSHTSPNTPSPPSFNEATVSDVNLLDLDLDLEELGGVLGENLLGVWGEQSLQSGKTSL